MEEIIEKNNPWWFGKEDHTLKKWEARKIKWVPKWIEGISLEPFSLNFVVGFRQLGKTTGIKFLIKKILEKEKAESVFYFDCDFLPDWHSLKKILDEYLKFTKVNNIEKSYIFLDEITSVQEWWRVIKGYVDLGIFENDVITITGSSSLKLKGEAELFPGRRGKGKDVFVKPLSFREFLEVRGLKIEVKGNLENDMERASKYESRIRELFEGYLKSGGFPLSINEDPTAEKEFLAAFESEVLKAKYNLQLMKEVISSIFRKAPSPVSFSTIGREIGVSYKTVQEYVEVLRRMFLLEMGFFREKNVVWRKERKFFFLDPFIARTFSMWSGEKFLESAFFEWLVQSHLFRKFGEVFYYRNSFEIDCIAGNLRVEVKVGKPHVNYPKDVLIVDKDNLPLFLSVL